MPGAGETCGTCYGDGLLPTDQGPVDCPDCGGAGALPSPGTLTEWRLRQIESVHAQRSGEAASDIRWLAFELRCARDALTEILTLADEVKDSAAAARIRFVANRAVRMYEITPAGTDSPAEP